MGMKEYDAIVIGFGKAGKTLAPDMASRGLKVALVEKSPQMYGGTCINVGCIPSKSLVASSREAVIRNSSDWSEKQAFYKQAVEEKNRLTAMLRQKNYDRVAAAGVDVYDGAASFAGDNQVEVQNGGKSEILTAPKIFINTGAAPFLPPIKGIDGSLVYTSETLMNLEKLPETLVILGGGYIGLEFASIYAGFGSKVIILQDQPVFLPREDEDIAAEIKKVMEGEGVEFQLGVKVEAFVEDGNKVRADYVDASGNRREIVADAVLAAAGRRPNTSGLNLEKAHVKLNEFGGIEVDETLQTSNPDVWALGDVNGGLQFTYVSLDDYRIVRSRLFGDKGYDLHKRKNVPYSVFITPPYSRVGLNEKEARAAGADFKVLKLPVAAFPKAHVYKDTRGIMKVLVDKKGGRLLGAMLFCAESPELINLLKLAMDKDVSVSELRDNIYTHPTMSEAFNDLFSLV